MHADLGSTLNRVTGVFLAKSFELTPFGHVEVVESVGKLNEKINRARQGIKRVQWGCF